MTSLITVFKFDGADRLGKLGYIDRGGIADYVDVKTSARVWL